MNIIDLIIMLPITIGLVMGLFKGFIKELISLVAIILGIWGARKFEPHMTNLLISLFDFQPATAQPIAYLILFIIIAIGLLILAHLLDKFLSAIALGGINKLLGGIFGAIKYALIVSVLLSVFNALDKRFSIVESDKKESSLLYYPLMKVAPELWKETKNILFDEKS